ncbi:2-hydroxychromene-2-carboxylate isomerase [Ascidiaceihabitans donghaensis]|uniref:2-hydroxychromene-2-carboxylate isomerase n=1 Tax=Ascidiaceihabitans donghaensis TaxID=1510460 RepID=A0A2R8BBY6_9RHOB|nr:2-hydroxychromene-2-carboxylate isomerase [Ascidiaceihabitans donghaensis]SPH20579.1 2-hydroxychromene-2-carboxylate isomerase [Ascidiaceihabitans donghaensis]
MPKLTFWYELASTYSYLSAMRIDKLADEFDVTVTWRPFLLGPIFGAQGWTTSPFNLFPAKGENMWRDMERQAIKYGLPDIKHPDPFPQNTMLAARLATLGATEPWGPAFTKAMYSRQFAQGFSIATSEDVASVLQTLNLDGEALITQAQTDQTVKDTLRATTHSAQELGLYGSPSFTTEDGELFWGNDRLEDALAWAKAL